MSEDSIPGPTPRISDDEIIDLFRDTDDPVLSTAEVTELIPLKRRATYNRLRSLADEGRLESKQIGGRNTVWWLAESEKLRPRSFLEQ
jgi:predicted transcriptional regulator